MSSSNKGKKSKNRFRYHPVSVSIPKAVPTLRLLAVDVTQEEYDDMFPCFAEPPQEELVDVFLCLVDVTREKHNIDSDPLGISPFAKWKDPVEEHNIDSNPEDENENDFAKLEDSVGEEDDDTHSDPKVGEEDNTDSNPKGTNPKSFFN
ncbi:hypothetical protein A2U01_0015984 [Trifolium medium]|uniref:Uncharacterized protein n=1 Tax=Trifolium medium TaxID=97028 RepID=A0A392N5J1_9FABA|nr:hypothetical protein [Trifolium medium]